jgi:hypothetical protein
MIAGATLIATIEPDHTTKVPKEYSDEELVSLVKRAHKGA